MTAGARFDARRDSRHEYLADDDHGRAELAEWERIDELLPAGAPGTVYAPDSDDVVQAELAAAREAELRPVRASEALDERTAGPAADTAALQRREPAAADAVRAYVAKTRANADQFVTVLVLQGHIWLRPAAMHKPPPGRLYSLALPVCPG
ncbi:hypothetical protein ACFRCI_18785 [Streptomyces sp. NPDC056638]|uniref:hypothetical protein n=1 Tax=Streptomyces sp. NPDC056638 TaxID=3345887 RepID=UPI0036870DC6